MTRIVSGTRGGRTIATPAGRDTRPTSDRVREALFSALDAMTDVDGARFADLYAGSGAVGLEAASRGAAHVLLVEAHPKAARTIRDNIATLGLGGVCRLAATTVSAALAAGPPGGPFDIVFADPPYAVPDNEVHTVQTGLVDGGWLATDAVVVLERSARSPALTWVPGVTGDRVRRYGETALWYGRRTTREAR